MAVTAVVSGAPASTASAPSLAAPQFLPSGLDGAGFQNVIATDPFHDGVVLAGADVSGVARSADSGRTWTRVNVGLGSYGAQRIASLVFSPTVPGKVYAATGKQGRGGGIFVSTDQGITWTRRSEVPQFSGSNNRLPAQPDEHPRSTGTLVAVDRAGTVYTATYNDGVMRSTDDGRTWRTLGLQGHYLRSIALDPQNPDTVYAAAFDGVFRTRDARAAGTFSALPAAPHPAEELLALGTSVYVAAGTDGVFRSRDGGATWTQLGVPRGPAWISIDGYLSGGTPVVFAGSTAPGAARASLVRSSDGGTTWTSLTQDPAHLHPEVGGPSGPRWWLYDDVRAIVPGYNSYVAAQIAVDRRHPSTVFVAGRSGLWGSSDGGQDWYPMVRGLGVTMNQTVVADPNSPGRVYVGNTDWMVLSSRDGLRTVRQTRPDTTGTVGFSIALDTATTPSRVFVGTGGRDGNSDGDLLSNPDPLGAGTWTSEGLGALTGHKRVLGVAVNRIGGERVVLAAVQNAGLWRQDARGWRSVNGTAMRGAPDLTVSIAWPAGARTAYLYDHASGVWRSRDGGVSWSLLWSQRSTTIGTGHVLVDPGTPSRLYVSATDGVFAINGADGAAGAPTRLPVAGKPGPLTAGPSGHLYLATPAAAGGPAGLLTSTDHGTSWSPAADSTYRSTATFPTGLAVGPSGELYASMNGTGALVGNVG